MAIGRWQPDRRLKFDRIEQDVTWIQGKSEQKSEGKTKT
jgi:hypothetical protein